MSEANRMLLEDAEAEAAAIPSDADIQSVADLARKQERLEAAIEQKEFEIKELKRELEQVSTKDIPDRLSAFGLSEIKLSDGSRITVEREIHASIPQAKKSAAFAWLREHNADSIIKNEVKLTFGKGEDHLAKEAANKLRADGFAPTVAESIHPQTLKAFVKERDESGEPVPADLFGVFPINRSKIRRPK